jgi:2-isopropylmalate synthase
LGEKADRVVFSTHCQNDLGLSTANSIAGAAHGARQIECTINGIGGSRRPAVPSRRRRASSPGMMEVGGFFLDFEANTMLRAGERAGNAALEEVVMALALKGPTHFGEKGPTGSGPDLRTGIDPVHITPTSNMVKEYTGMAVQPHKAIVGANAFQHESGIHQDGMIKNKQTYEIMTPESIGLMRGDQQSGAGIVLGKHSGRNAVSTRLNELGYDLDDDKLQSVFIRFKEVAERKKGGLDDDDLEALVADEVYSAQAMWRLERVQVTTGSGVVPTATVALTGPDGVERQGVAMGTGPVDAAYKAIDALTSVKVHLETYSMESVNAGIEAMATTKVVVNPVDSATSLHSSGYTTSRKFSGSGSDTDVVVSSARAYVAAVNKLIRWNMRRAAAEQVEAQEA